MKNTANLEDTRKLSKNVPFLIIKLERPKTKSAIASHIRIG